MVKDLFIQPRFVGPRFEEHTLPVAAVKDLAAYEELILELAKHLYREKHPNRARVPKGFGNDFNLHLEKIEEGSTVPRLVAVYAGLQMLVSLPGEFGEARELVNRVIATEAGQAFPTGFPKEFYSYFNRIGRSLAKNEAIEWAPGAPGNVSALTPTKRKRLVLAHRETYEATVEIVGAVEELNARKRSGSLRVQEGNLIGFVYDDPFLEELKAALGNKTTRVRLKGIGEFDVNDRLGEIIEIDQLENLPHYPLMSAVEELSSLGDGWLEGHGVAPSSENITWLTDELAKMFPNSLDYPSVGPTEEGNLVLEWIRPDARVELEVNFVSKGLELYSTNCIDNSFVEESFNEGEWDLAFGRVKELLSA